MIRRKAFTLIELLVVVAIIALLIAILLPSLAKAKARANTANCLANTRSMGATMQLYVSDWQKMFPFYSDPAHSWTQLLMNGGQTGTNGAILQTGGYGAIAKLRVCPEAPQMTGNPPSPTFGTAHLQWGNSIETGVGVAGSYGMNGWLYNNQATDQGLASMVNERGTAIPDNYYHVPMTKKDSDIPVFADANWRHIFAKPGDGAPPSLENPGPIDVVNHPIWRLILNRHDKAINISFIDGHAETVGLKDVYKVQWTANWVPPNPIPVLPNQ